ncbi:EmrB/QacA family drug resistance transporter [Caballeronia udeis]|uniref:EmrB/QacA family drug resistance transporter n=1 Tax=Caballeronia udeis TaxID=1232866 RepID=A0A158GX35_9BURK|nr:EmrB/QacA family drug resistance transporter [Caballeronia udeis]
MAFAPWCAVTLSLRRFIIGAALMFALLGLLCPFAPNVETLAVLRALQGLAGGCLPPMLMTAALRYLPPNIKLYGLASYALTATFGPDLGTPLAAFWTEYVNWRMVFWQVVPLCLVSTAAIAYGLPQDPQRLERFRSFNWVGLLTGFPAISMLVIGQQKTQRPVQFEISERPATALRRRPGRRGVRLSFEAGSVHGRRSGRRRLLRKMQPVLLCLVLFDQPIDGRARHRLRFEQLFGNRTQHRLVVAQQRVACFVQVL